MKTLTNLVRQKLDDTNQTKWLPQPNNFTEFLNNSKPLACIYNIISWSVNPRKIKNKMYVSGYTDVNSSHDVDKVAAITQV